MTNTMCPNPGISFWAARGSNRAGLLADARLAH